MAALLAVRKRVAVSSLALQLGPRRLILVPLVYTRTRHLHTFTRASLWPGETVVYISSWQARDDCRTLAPARAAAPIKTPLLEVLSRCLLVLALSLFLFLSLFFSSFVSSRKEERGRESGEEDSPPFVLSLEEEPGAVHVPTFDRTKDYRPNR